MTALWTFPNTVIALTLLHHGGGAYTGEPLLMARDLQGRGLGFAVREHQEGRGHFGGGEGSARSQWLPGMRAHQVMLHGQGQESRVPDPYLPGAEPGRVLLLKGPIHPEVSATPTSWTEGNHRPVQLDTMVIVPAGREGDGPSVS